MTHHHHGKSLRRSNGNGKAMTLARGLGWFSVGLGALEVMAPGALARFLGARRTKPLVQAYGVREIATGAGILAAGQPAPWMWGRVAGDALDLATLLSIYRNPGAKKANVGLAMLAVAGVTALDVVCAQSLAGKKPKERKPVRDYSDRVGMKDRPEVMRGAARNVNIPRDMRTPEPLRPYAGA